MAWAQTGSSLIREASSAGPTNARSHRTEIALDPYAGSLGIRSMKNLREPASSEYRQDSRVVRTIEVPDEGAT